MVAHIHSSVEEVFHESADKYVGDSVRYHVLFKVARANRPCYEMAVDVNKEREVRW